MRYLVQLLGPPILGSPHDEPGIHNLPRLREKTVALAAYLCTEATAVRRDTAATLLWPASSQKHARANLRTSLVELRRVIGHDAVEATQELISIPNARSITDLHGFRDLAAGESRAGWWQAIRLYRADFLSGFSVRGSAEFDTWMLLHAESLREEYYELLRRTSEAEEQEGNLDPATVAAELLISADPLDEASHQRLMRLLLMQRKWTSALRRFEECRHILREQLNTEPGDATYALKDAAVAQRLDKTIFSRV